jgi:hypothetical protein
LKDDSERENAKQHQQEPQMAYTIEQLSPRIPRPYNGHRYTPEEIWYQQALRLEKNHLGRVTIFIPIYIQIAVQITRNENKHIQIYHVKET